MATRAAKAGQGAKATKAAKTGKAAEPAKARKRRAPAKAAQPATGRKSSTARKAAAPAKAAKAAAPAAPAAPAASAKAAKAARPKRHWVVRVSPIHGRGVFAARKIRKNHSIIEYRGERVSWKEANRRPPSDPDNPYHTFLFGLDDGRVIDADVGGNSARWINHSCKPNCEAQEDDEGRVFIVARRKIQPGEELTYDYQLTYDGKVGKKMRKAYACRCGARKCRGTMLGKDNR